MISSSRLLIKKGSPIKAATEASISHQQISHYGRLSHLKLDELQAAPPKESPPMNMTKSMLPISFSGKRMIWPATEKSTGKVPLAQIQGTSRLAYRVLRYGDGLLGPTIDIHVGGVDNMFPTTKMRLPSPKPARISALSDLDPLRTPSR